MLARIPQSGDSSGAALGVRSIALLQIAKWSRSLHGTWRLCRCRLQGRFRYKNYRKLQKIIQNSFLFQQKHARSAHYNIKQRELFESTTLTYSEAERSNECEIRTQHALQRVI